MMQMYRLQGAAWFFLILILLGATIGVNARELEPPGQSDVSKHESTTEAGDKDVYTGVIRIYVVEPVGRWTDKIDRPFHNAFLAFALEDSVYLTDTDTLIWELEWDGHNYFDDEGQPFDDVLESNLQVIAVVFNSDGYPGYSDPPSGYEFTVHETDACAATNCGSTGYNFITDDFTHSVLVEDFTSTW
jgi:hypothetical protein